MSMDTPKTSLREIRYVPVEKPYPPHTIARAPDLVIEIVEELPTDSQENSEKHEQANPSKNESETQKTLPE